MRSNNEPVRIRYKDLANGTKSIYLDTYKSGKRSYEFLKLYLLPEDDDKAKAVNTETLQKAEAIKNQRVQEILSGKLETVKASLEHPASTTTTSKKTVRVSKKEKVGSAKTAKVPRERRVRQTKLSELFRAEKDTNGSSLMMTVRTEP